jgi:hypothetical protein
MKLKFKQVAFKFVKALTYGAAGAALAAITPEAVTNAAAEAGVPAQYVQFGVLILTAALGHGGHNVYDQKK